MFIFSLILLYEIIIHVKIIVFWVHSFKGNVSDGMGIANGYHMALIDGRLGEI
jgi:hypothetical protein